MTDPLATEEVALLPCPFCAGAAKLNSFMFNVWTVDCAVCEISTRPDYHCADPKGKAIEVWNTRTRQGVLATFSPCCKFLREGECAPGIMHDGLCMCEKGPTIYLIESFRIPARERS